MKQCDNEYIVQFYDVYVTNSFVFICIEYCAGGDLLEYLNERGRPIREPMASKYMKQALTGLQYLHNMGIAHRDIKPENILLTADRQTVKLADFGLSHQATEESQKFYTQCGSITHIAPEVFTNKGYDHRIDIWSLGVVLYVMLSVSYPFNHPDKNQIIKMIFKANLDFEADPIWENKSLDSKDLILLMLTTNPDKRLSIDQCLKHPFVAGKKARAKPIVNKKKVKSFTSARLMKSRSRAVHKEPELNEKEMQGIGVQQDDEEEEARDAEEIARARAATRDGSEEEVAAAT